MYTTGTWTLEPTSGEDPCALFHGALQGNTLTITRDDPGSNFQLVLAPSGMSSSVTMACDHHAPDFDGCSTTIQIDRFNENLITLEGTFTDIDAMEGTITLERSEGLGTGCEGALGFAAQAG